MERERWAKVQEIFAAAMELDQAARRDWLERTCAGDAALLNEVASLLRSAEEPGDFIARAVEEVVAVAPRAEAAEGQRIGAYQVVREIGRGGMGAVYLAVRADDAYRKQVAIKIVATGAPHGEMLARFRRERQILASLDHPNIARLLDGGETESGLSFVVMEHVEGEPIDAWCDRSQASTRARLELFLKVCEAVSHAHRSLVVHRDIKPGNILVTKDGTPKLLDFGIAKLLGPEPEEGDAPVTLTVARLLTPEYASPEQVRGDAITTASDVYALGVLLYELLTGRRPYRLAGTQPLELEKAICEQEPERPSTAVTRPIAPGREGGRRGATTRDASSETLSHARGTQPQRLRRILEGDLDNIVLMALRKEPSRRYVSVDAFAADLRRHIEGLPVLARKDTISYRAAKFIKRHRAGVAAASIVVLLLAGLGVTLAVQAARLRAERDRANAERDRANAERDRAAAERKTAEKTAEFMEGLFKVADPEEWKGREIPAREIVDRGAERIESELKDEPLVQARLMLSLGQVYKSMGRYDTARPLLSKAVELQEKTLGPEHVDLGRTLMSYANACSDVADYAAARAAYDRALAIYEKAEGPGGHSVAKVLNNIGILLRSQGDLKGARAMYERSLAIKEKLLPPEHPSLLVSMTNSANLAVVLGDYARARDLYDRVLAVREKTQPADSTIIADTLFNQGVVLAKTGDARGALQRYQRAMGIYERSGGPDHVDVAGCLENMANEQTRAGDYAAARPNYERALAIAEKAYGAKHPHVGEILGGYGGLLLRTGDLAAAEKIYQRSIDAIEGSAGGEHPSLSASLSGLAEVRARRGDAARARPLAERALRIAEKAFGASNVDTLGSLIANTRVARLAGDLPSARSLAARALAISSGTPSPRDDDRISALLEASAAALAAGESGEAASLKQMATVALASCACKALEP